MAVYTCTMNLAIDLVIQTQEMLPSVVNRTEFDEVQANGKGINVSFIMKKLNLDSTALGFAAGFTGEYIKDCVQKKNIATDFIFVSGTTRINVFTQVKNSKEEFKLVNRGPIVDKVAQQKLLQQINQLKKDDYLVVSGSLPRGVDPSILLDIGKICKKNGVHLIYDISQPILIDCLKYNPFLIKPNDEELSSWFGEPISSIEQLKKYGKKLIQLGAQHVVISLGSRGAFYIDSQYRMYQCNAPSGKVVNTACAGDTLLATFITGLIRNEDITTNLPYAVCAGSSTAFKMGLTDFSDVEELVKQIKIEKVED